MFVDTQLFLEIFGQVTSLASLTVAWTVAYYGCLDY